MRTQIVRSCYRPAQNKVNTKYREYDIYSCWSIQPVLRRSRTSHKLREGKRSQHKDTLKASSKRCSLWSAIDRPSARRGVGRRRNGNVSEGGIGQVLHSIILRTSETIIVHLLSIGVGLGLGSISQVTGCDYKIIPIFNTLYWMGRPIQTKSVIGISKK
ncbi:hypothetical protein ElyMa_004873800 [Elysia marginata]|uniref:Cytochrome-c oxidase n=1 Tax=Elysia marginata TaxID=1093978 RepID=A0AAV4IRK8_9GAST|nr:hypothetical protein ElyMa_004873800 [Elysia marginata]